MGKYCSSLFLSLRMLNSKALYIFRNVDITSKKSEIGQLHDVKFY